MERYLISLDLDGTLLTKKRKISFTTKRYLRRLAKKGHVVVINTGRPYSGCLHLYEDLNIRQYPLCCNNGAVIAFFQNDHVTFETTPVNANTITALLKEVKPYAHGGYALDEYEHYFFDMDSVPPFIQKYHNPQNPIFCTLDDVVKPTIVSYTIYVKESNLEAAKRIFAKEEYSSLHRIFWGIHDEEASFNFASSAVSKATAIERMQELYGITNNHVIAFGDSYNDIDMLEKAHYGVCMINGRPDMVAKAPLTTKKDNNHNGIVHYLKTHFHL